MNVKKNPLIALAAIAVFIAGAIPAAASSSEDWRIIKKAAHKGKSCSRVVRGKARRLRIVVMEARGKDESLRITLPFGFVEDLVRLASVRHVRRCDLKRDVDFDRDFDFERVLARLKRAGPGSLLEVRDGDSIVKVRLE
jgi:hypothetical protein